MQNLNPLDVLKQELDTDQIASKVNAIHKLKIVATLIGSDGIRNTLLPYLDTLIKKQEDEVLFAIAEEIGNLAPMLGANQMAVLPYLDNLCGQDETVVRDMAVKAIVNMIPTVSDAEINNHIIPMVIKLASNEANFTWRVSAANIMCKIYPRAGPNKQKLRQKFTELSNQQTPMVRRVIATKIGQMAQVYQKQNIINDLIPAFKQLSADDQDLVRVLCLDSLKSLAKVLSRDDNKTHTLPVIIQAAEDKSWRVRLALSKNFSDIAESFGKEITDLSLVQTFSALLKDVENDVKIEAVKNLSRFVRIVSVDKLHILIPLIIVLGKDAYPNVRSQITNVLGSIVGLVPKDLAYQKLLPLIGDLMKDDNQEVRQGAIRAVCKFGQAVGPEIINTITPYLKTASEDPKWRVRVQAISAAVSLAIAYQNFDIFMKFLQPIYMLYLRDRAAAVRQYGVQRIPDLLKPFSSSWLTTFMSKLNDILSKDNTHFFKIAAIYSLRQIAILNQQLAERITGIILKSLSDPIPNIRIVSIKALKDLAKRYEGTGLRDQIKKALVTLSEDPDKDVKFFCVEAVSGL